MEPDEALGQALIATEPGHIVTAYALVVCAEQPDGTIDYHLHTPQGQAQHVTLGLLGLGMDMADE